MSRLTFVCEHGLLLYVSTRRGGRIGIAQASRTEGEEFESQPNQTN